MVDSWLAPATTFAIVRASAAVASLAYIVRADCCTEVVVQDWEPQDELGEHTSQIA